LAKVPFKNIGKNSIKIYAKGSIKKYCQRFHKENIAKTLIKNIGSDSILKSMQKVPLKTYVKGSIKNYCQRFH
jgi:cytoskeletal protein RodZ